MNLKSRDQILLEAAYSKILEADSFLEYPQGSNSDVFKNFDKHQKFKFLLKQIEDLKWPLIEKAAKVVNTSNPDPQKILDLLGIIGQEPDEFFNILIDELKTEGKHKKAKQYTQIFNKLKDEHEMALFINHHFLKNNYDVGTDIRDTIDYEINNWEDEYSTSASDEIIEDMLVVVKHYQDFLSQ